MAWQARFHITFTFCYKCLLLMLMLYLMMMMTLILFFDILGDMNGIAFLKCRSFERQICAKAIIFPILPANSIDATEKEFLLLSGPYCCLASKTKQRLQIKNINTHTHTPNDDYDDDDPKLIVNQRDFHRFFFSSASEHFFFTWRVPKIKMT